jgi:hypothetical protein
MLFMKKKKKKKEEDADRNSDVHVKNQPQRSVLNKGISVHFV